MSSLIQCIYCGSTFDSARGAGDHIIPSHLGEFRDDCRFRRMCPGCNSKIGRCEQQMVQSGPEGFFRQIVRPRSKRLNKRGIGPARGAMGAPPPKHMVDMGDHLALVKPVPNSPKDMSPTDHILVRDVSGNETHVRLFPGIRSDQIRKALENAGVGEMKKARLHCGEEQWPEYTSLMKEMWPTSSFEEGDPTPVGVRPDTPCTIQFVVNDRYFQAVAKIGFHYFLSHSRRGFKGDEPCFADIRRFIMDGGNSDQFFKSDKRPTFMLPFGELPGGGVVTPNQWCHILAACEAGRQAVAYVQLFVGRGCIPSPHHISLGHWDSPIVTPKSTWGHVYLYDDPQQNGRYAGRVENAQISRVRPR